MHITSTNILVALKYLSLHSISEEHICMEDIHMSNKTNHIFFIITYRK